MKYHRTCSICGEEFIATNYRVKVCPKDHYLTCPVCGKEYIHNSTKVSHGCSRSCSAKASMDKKRKTNLERYGVENPRQAESIKERSKKTCLERYGVENPMSNPDIAKKSGNSRRSSIKKFEINLVNLNDQHKLCREQLIESLLRGFHEEYETDFIIESTSWDFKIYDSLLSISNYSEDKHFNLNKTKLAESHGYRCIHIWDWDDIDKVIDLIRPKVKIGARKCEIYRINPRVGNEFLERYHLQGSCRGQLIYLGLVYDDELVQLMTFGKPRYNKKYTCELLRLCTKSGYSIVGGASKLFKWALEHHELGDIISYCDRSKFSGSVYFHMGMSLKTTTPPQEVWSRDGEYITANLLRQRGYDQLFGTSYGRGTSNDLLMLQHGWLPIYDCGQSVYEFKQ